MYYDNDPELITKKFWSHIKSKTNCHRLPECMHRNSRYRNTPGDKAELFNTFFYDQFSKHSNYDINIDWSNDSGANDIDFDQNRIKTTF